MPGTIDGARKVMKQNNIPTSFLDKAVNIVTPFTSILGIKKENILHDVDMLKGNKQTNNQRVNIAKPRNQNKNNFKSKYPKL